MNAALLRLILAQISIHACMTGMRMATPLLALREGFSAASPAALPQGRAPSPSLGGVADSEDE